MILNSSVLNGLTVISQLGSGIYGSVISARLNNGKIVAIKTQKIRNKYEDIFSSAILEVDALIKLQATSSAVKLEGIVVDHFQIRILLEPMACNLTTYINQLSIASLSIQFKPFLISTLTALAVLESLGIQHFDIKPENILVAPGMVFKLADFGISRCPLRQTFSRAHIYSMWYRPPEYLSEYPLDKIPPHVSDVWALAVTGYLFLTKTYLFKFNDPMSLLAKILENMVDGRYKINVVFESTHILEWMMTINPTNRPLASQILSQLNVYYQIPPPIIPNTPRKIIVRWLNTLWMANQELKKSYVIYVITIELLGRFLDSKGSYPVNYPHYLIGAHYLAILYIDNPGTPLADVIKGYSKYTTCTVQEVSIALDQILYGVNFVIYNPILTARILSKQLCWVELHPSRTPKEEYLKPVSDWFK